MSIGCQLIAVAADSAVGIPRGWLLGPDAGDTRLQGRELGPISAVQGQVNNAFLLHGCTDHGSVCFNVAGAGLYVNRLRYLSRRQTEVEFSYPAYRKLDSLLEVRCKSWRGDTDGIDARREILRAVQTLRVGCYGTNFPCRVVLDYDVCRHDHGPGRVRDLPR